MERQGVHLRLRCCLTGRVLSLVKFGLDPEAGGRSCTADQVDNGLKCTQWLASPILRDVAEQAVREGASRSAGPFHRKQPRLRSGECRPDLPDSGGRTARPGYPGTERSELPLSARTLFDGAVITVFDGRRSPTGTMEAGCRMAVTESSRDAAPALRFGPSGDPPPSTRRSAAMAVSQLTATGRSPDALCAGMRCAWSRHSSARWEQPVPVPVPSNS